MDNSAEILGRVKVEMAKVVVGQEELIDNLLLALLCNGHVLIEGVPGVAKTLTVNTLSKAFGADFSRIQFTPDLLPSDLTGTLIYNAQTHEFTAEKGPLFASVVLADEINRAPAKVQSALLEAMQEKQVTLGRTTYDLPNPFFVLATQNPVEQEGTYELPEAQVDRFMFKLKVGYPSLEEEHLILKRMATSAPKLAVEAVSSLEEIVKLRDSVDAVFMDEKIEQYILRLIDATRSPEKYGLEITRYIRFGASPRATIFLTMAGRARALMMGRDYVVPQDIKDVAHDVMRHRIAISYRAEAEGLNSDALLDQILGAIPIEVSADA